MRALLQLIFNMPFMQLSTHLRRKRENRSLTWNDVFFSLKKIVKIEDVGIFKTKNNHVTFTAFSKDLLNARFPCSTASLTLPESQHEVRGPMLRSCRAAGVRTNPLPSGTLKNIAAGIYPFLIGNTSSIRVHFPASYVRLPECIWIYPLRQ